MQQKSIKSVALDSESVFASGMSRSAATFATLVNLD